MATKRIEETEVAARGTHGVLTSAKRIRLKNEPNSQVILGDGVLVGKTEDGKLFGRWFQEEEHEVLEELKVPRRLLTFGICFFHAVRRLQHLAPDARQSKEEVEAQNAATRFRKEYEKFASSTITA